MNKKESSSRNYSNVVFAHFFNNNAECYERGYYHFMIFVFSGELSIREIGKEKVVVSAGECIFVRRDHHLHFTKQPTETQQYKGITMTFDRNFLWSYYQRLDENSIPVDVEPIDVSVKKLRSTPSVKSLFYSMLPYFDANEQPLEEVMKLKQQEGILTLLSLDKRFYPTLFDFTEPWKIDIFDFLNENYMYEFSQNEIALYTGRSLSTFKRDFKKISDLSPQRWLMNKRLEVANEKLQNQGKKVSEVYMEVGFKNRTHFATAYKKKYGYSPTEALVG